MLSSTSYRHGTETIWDAGVIFKSSVSSWSPRGSCSRPLSSCPLSYWVCFWATSARLQLRQDLFSRSKLEFCPPWSRTGRRTELSVFTISLDTAHHRLGHSLRQLLTIFKIVCLPLNYSI